MKLIVHSKPDCPFCQKAKAFLAEKNLPYTEKVWPELDDRQRVYDALQLRGVERTMPQIVLTDDDGEHMRIGGWDKLLVSGIESLGVDGFGEGAVFGRDGDPANSVEVMTRRTAASTTPVFSLLPVDKFAVATVDFWIAQAMAELGEDHPKIGLARQRRGEMVAWQEIYGTKTPD